VNPVLEGPECTAQQVFDHVVRHLALQGKRAMKGGACRYRSPEGLSCAAGCCLRDEEYDPRMEGESLEQTSTATTPGLFPARLQPHLRLLVALQRVHDSEERVHYWPELLVEVGLRHKLDISIVKEAYSVQ
jgi:hypothetical protein